MTLLDISFCDCSTDLTLCAKDVSFNIEYEELNKLRTRLSSCSRSPNDLILLIGDATFLLACNGRLSIGAISKINPTPTGPNIIRLVGWRRGGQRI